MSSILQVPIVASGSGDEEGALLLEEGNLELGQHRFKRQRHEDLDHATVEIEL